MATPAELTNTASEGGSIRVAANDRRIRARLAEVLTAQSELRVVPIRSARELVDAEVDCRVLVFYSESISTEDLALFNQLKSLYEGLSIVAVSRSVDVKNARRAIDKGVDGLLFDQQLDVALLPTVMAVLAGQTVVPQELRAAARRPSLSFREKQVLGMVVMGFTNGEIGNRLFLAESTVKSHLSSAFSKLGVRSRSEAAAMILDPEGSLGTGILSITGSREWKPPTL